MASNSEIYYFEIGKGEWAGEFWFGIIDWSQFWKARISLKNRFLALAMSLVIKVFGRAVFHSRMAAFPDQGEAGVASNAIRLSRFGITLFISNEDYVLNPTAAASRSKRGSGSGRYPFCFASMSSILQPSTQAA